MILLICGIRIFRAILKRSSCPVEYLLQTDGQSVPDDWGLRRLSVAVFVSIWSAYGFRFSAFSATNRPAIFGRQLEFLREEGGGFNKVPPFARSPSSSEAFLGGLALRACALFSPACFFDGKWSLIGFRSLFPRLAYKQHAAFAMLIAAALAAAVIRWRKRHCH